MAVSVVRRWARGIEAGPSRPRHVSASTPPPGTGRAALSAAGWDSPSARCLVEAHGGRIRAEEPSGVAPRRALHLHDPGGRGVTGAGPAPDRPVPAGPRIPDAVPILVVDDDPETLRHLRDTLAEAGYAPLVTDDPRELARIIRAEKYPTGPARPDAARDRRRRADADRSRARRPRRSSLSRATGSDDDHRSGAGGRRRRLRGQAVLADRAHRRASGRPCAGGRTPPPSSSATSPSTTSGGGSAWHGRPVTLTATEYELLRVLAQAAGRVLTHEALLRQVWAGSSPGPRAPGRQCSTHWIIPKLSIDSAITPMEPSVCSPPPPTVPTDLTSRSRRSAEIFLNRCFPHCFKQNPIAPIDNSFTLAAR